MARERGDAPSAFRSDALRAGRKALDIAQLCTLRALPESIVREIDRPLVHLLAEAEASVRARVALKLAQCSWAPREAVRLLAFDPIDIASPILESSVVLSEDDLLRLVELSREHRLKIATRKSVSAPVCEAIASQREVDCLETLAGNPGAEIPDTAASDFVAVAETQEDLQTTLAERADLSDSFKRALFEIAADHVKATLIRALPDLDPSTIDQTVAEADSFKEALGSDSAAEQLVGQLIAQNALTKSDVLRAASGGRSDIADHAIARLTGLHVSDWRRNLSRAPVRTTLLAARSMAMTVEEAAKLYTAWSDSGRAHELNPMALAKACSDTYSAFARDEARRALHRLGAGVSIQ